MNTEKAETVAASSLALMAMAEALDIEPAGRHLFCAGFETAAHFMKVEPEGMMAWLLEELTTGLSLSDEETRRDAHQFLAIWQTAKDRMGEVQR